jgi:hypothetical protein
MQICMNFLVLVLGLPPIKRNCVENRKLVIFIEKVGHIIVWRPQFWVIRYAPDFELNKNNLNNFWLLLKPLTPSWRHQNDS